MCVRVVQLAAGLDSMSVKFQDAVSTLTSMFPAIDSETIGELLRSRGGHMESTVEVLLTLTGDGQPEAAQVAPAGEQRSATAGSRCAKCSSNFFAAGQGTSKVNDGGPSLRLRRRSRTPA